MAYQPSMTQLPLPIPVPHTDPGSVDSKIASTCMQRLIFSELQKVGYQSAQSAAVCRLEIEVTACESQFYIHIQKLKLRSCPAALSART
jgi:hypothetical protein